ncbi:winged helix-turn-helix transcriptional regulator [Dactylosporangium matsuzakiense]|uniref:HxlR family transcriptional regulator n=1 Tax=Dactylosporangium matsuzakiense TaxID=53360 RepID=A0A9W6KU27_9ACTN|nr:helix-turn-helix domain-containing protein [Dactylosporangium matsuzakiense]GLL08116.1 HxlR family transcriptional regulator [Dactylosporangium matsuzakiense]
MSQYHQFCGLARALDVIGDRWNLLIVRELLIGERRHHDLRAALPGIATNLLGERLRQLTAAGIVERRGEAGRKAVSYRLTELGHGLREPVLGLVRWGAAFMAAGPRPEDTVQPQWLALALDALLPATGLPADVGILVTADGSEFTIRATGRPRVVPHRDGRIDATIEAPTSVVLGLFAGALTLDSPAASRARITDPHELLAHLLPAMTAPPTHTT